MCSQTKSVESPDCGDMTDLAECTPTALEDVPTAEDMATPATPATAMSTATSSSPGDATPSSLPQEPPLVHQGQETRRPHRLHCPLSNVVTQLSCGYPPTDIIIDSNMLGLSLRFMGEGCSVA